MHLPSLIEKKRDGGELSSEEIAQVISGFTRGEIPDYQMSALAMAIFFRGMSDMETWYLTKAMLESGQIFEYPPNTPPKVDKHSTGAIGGKTSLVLAPLLACDDLWVPMISGRGLDITGGTLDKLESIPGFNVNLDRRRAIKQLERIGVFMIGQTAEICLADKKLYALRDVTGTVPSRPLIVASIMCKKLAENLDRLVLNVRFGKGAFMKTRDKAQWLGEAMLRVGEGTGTQISYLLTAMDEPLGRTVGNALELAEAIDVLHGQGPPMWLTWSSIWRPKLRTRGALNFKNGSKMAAPGRSLFLWWKPRMGVPACLKKSLRFIRHLSPTKSDPIAPEKSLRWTLKRFDALHSCLGEATNK